MAFGRTSQLVQETIHLLKEFGLNHLLEVDDIDRNIINLKSTVKLICFKQERLLNELYRQLTYYVRQLKRESNEYKSK